MSAEPSARFGRRDGPAKSNQWAVNDAAARVAAPPEAAHLAWLALFRPELV